MNLNASIGSCVAEAAPEEVFLTGVVRPAVHKERILRLKFKDEARGL